MTPLGGLLLERVGPSLYELGHPLAERLEILVTAAATVWRPAPGSGLLSGGVPGEDVGAAGGR